MGINVKASISNTHMCGWIDIFCIIQDQDCKAWSFPPSVSTTFIHLKTTQRALHHCLTNNKLNINIRVLGHHVS